MLAHSVLLLASGQVPGAELSSEPESIFLYSLRAHLRFLRESGVAYETLYVRQADYLQCAPGILEGFDVRFISNRELYRLTAGGDSITVVQVSPVEQHRGQLVFQVADYAVSRRAAEYSTFKGCRSIYSLRLDCETNLFEVELIGQRKVLSF